MKRAIILLVLAGLVLAACTGGGEQNTPVPTAAQASGGIQPTQQQAPQGQTPAGGGGGSVPAGPAMEHLKAGTKVEIMGIRMFDPLQGWAVATAGGDDHIVRTFDNGQTWQDLTPPEPAGSGVAKRATMFFTGLQQGWVTFYPESGGPMSAVWYTTDGGKTWKASDALDSKGFEAMNFTAENLYFVDANTGWLALAGAATTDSQPEAIFSTTNGGASWERVSDTLKDQSGIGRCCRTGITFLDKNLGIMTASVSTDLKPHVYWTKDSGKTWTQQQIPPADEKLFGNSGCSTYSPNAVSSVGAVIVVDCIEYAGMDKTHNPFVYFTTDQGQTWKWLPAPQAAVADGKWESIERNFRITFLDAQVGWMFVEDRYTSKDVSKNKQLMQMFQTRDGGQTWKKITTVQWFGQFSFLSADTGWAAIVAGADAALLKTSDGGDKWDSFQPTIRE